MPPMTAFNPCSHGTLRILEINALGATVSCIHCSETFDLPENTVQKYYPFTHFSPQGPENDIQLLIHLRLIE